MSVGVSGQLWDYSARRFSGGKSKASCRHTTEVMAPIWALAGLSLRSCQTLSIPPLPEFCFHACLFGCPPSPASPPSLSSSKEVLKTRVPPTDVRPGSHSQLSVLCGAHEEESPVPVPALSPTCVLRDSWRPALTMYEGYNCQLGTV